MALVQHNASNSAGSQNKVGVMVAGLAALEDGVYVGAIAPLEAIVADPALTHAQRLDGLEKSAKWVTDLQSNVAHVSEVALLFVVTEIYRSSASRDDLHRLIRRNIQVHTHTISVPSHQFIN